MPRGDRSAHPHRDVSGAFRGSVGYHGVSADDAADPPVVFPSRLVTVPASSTSPLTAGSDTIAAGGGGITVDNGSDPPASVATLVAPGAQVADDTADLSDVLQFRMLGPFTVTPASANILNPADNGYLVTSIAANTYVFPIVVNKTAWDGDLPGIYITLSAAVDGPIAALLGGGDLAGTSNSAPAGLYAAVAFPADVNPTLPSWGFAANSGGIYVAVYTNSGTSTVGSTDISLLIATVN